MKRNTYWAAWLLLAASAAHADSLSYTNTITVPAGNPPMLVEVGIPRFDPAMGSLQGIQVRMAGSLISVFSWAEPAGGSIRVWQTNMLTVWYNSSEVLVRKSSVFTSLGYPTPVTGYGQQMWGTTLPPQTVKFSAAGDLQNFTGTGTVPLAADWYNLAMVTPFGPPGVWSLDQSGSVTVAVAYDFTGVPEPEAMGFLVAGVLTAVARKRARWKQLFVRFRSQL